MKNKFTFKNANKLLKIAFDSYYFDPEENVLHYQWTPNKNNFIIIVGENATGKSFLRRILMSIAKNAGVEYMNISMEQRTCSSGFNAFIYGSEQWEATGNNSTKTVLAGIKTCKERKTDHIIVWDEPDLGLSESWSISMGQKIQTFAQKIPKHTLAAVLITHNKPLLKELLSVKHNFVYLGTEKIESLEQWLEYTAPIKPLEQLAEENHEMFKKLTKLLDKLGIRT